jgi:siroheme synthase
VSEEVLSVIPPLTEKVYVGKEVGSEARADIPSLMIQSARQGKRVVRLKGGDPLIFGRGGEEMLALAQAGIEFEVVSGVSALSSVPAAAGIPVTCRGIASEIIVRSGHCLTQGPLEDAGDEPVTGATTGSPITYIYFMAAGRLAGIVEDLRREGLPPSTPVAMIQKGTLPDQQVLAGNLENIVELAEVQGVETPALFVAGEVVRFFYIQELLPALEETVRQGE